VAAVAARKGDVLIYPPTRPEMPFVAIRFAGYGLHTAGVAKSEAAARAMLQTNEEALARQAGNPKDGPPARS
jgi:hypothetical protein